MAAPLPAGTNASDFSRLFINCRHTEAALEPGLTLLKKRLPALQDSTAGPATGPLPAGTNASDVSGLLIGGTVVPDQLQMGVIVILSPLGLGESQEPGLTLICHCQTVQKLVLHSWNSGDMKGMLRQPRTHV